MFDDFLKRCGLVERGLIQAGQIRVMQEVKLNSQWQSYLAAPGVICVLTKV